MMMISNKQSTTADETTAAAQQTREFGLRWQNLSFTVHSRPIFMSGFGSVGSNESSSVSVKVVKLLNNVSGEIHPGQFIALLGPSGCGKTTLMNALAGRLSFGRLTGIIRVNTRGQKRWRDQSWLQMSAVVEQSTLFLQHVTVREAVMFASRLRLPRDLPHELKVQRVDEVLSILGLSKCSNTIISLISGGEKKRTAIAIEMITSPTFIFMDEPTSGLDAFNALALVECVSSLCRQERKAILMTIHQPRDLIMKHFTKIILMGPQGSVVFIGTVSEALIHFDSFGLTCPLQTNPCDFLLDQITNDNRSQKMQLESEERVLKLIQAWSLIDQHKTPIHNDEPSLDHQQSKTYNDYWRIRAPFRIQFRLLLMRYLTDYRRFKDALIALTVQTIAVAAFISMLFFQLPTDQASIQNRMGLLFFMTAQLTFAFTMPIAVSMPSEKLMIHHERQNMSYRTLAAYLAKIISVIPQAICSTILLASIVYWATGLVRSFEAFSVYLVTLISLSLCSQAFGMLIGSLMPSIQVAMIVGPMSVLLLVVFAGPMLNASQIPVAVQWIQYISPPSYVYSVLMNNEFSGLHFSCDAGVTTPCFISGQQVLEYYNLSMDMCWINVFFVWLLLVGFHVAGFTALYFITRPRGKLNPVSP